MLFCLLAALGVFVVQTMLPPTLRYVAARPRTWARLRIALGPRDEQPPLSAAGARASRALANMHEALPVFLALALVHIGRPTQAGDPELGAAIFVLARALYVPAYLSGIPGPRSAVWLASWVGLGCMLAPLLSAQ